MKMIQNILFFLLFIVTQTGLPAVAGEAAYPVQEIEDGDTLLVKIDGKAVRLQLLGIDAPEDVPNPKFKSDLSKTGLTAEQLVLLGQASTEHIKSLIGPDMMLSIQGELGAPDRYGRTPGILLNAAGKNLSEAMVQDGYAVALFNEGGGPDDDFMRRLDRLERFSRKSNNGLWGRYPNIMRDWYTRSR